MNVDYKPTPEQMAAALALLGDNPVLDPELRPDGWTQKDYPELAGRLLAVAEMTSMSVGSHTGEKARYDAYRDVFLDPALSDASDDDSKAEAWTDFLVTLTEAAHRVHNLHHTGPTGEHDPLDHALADAAAQAAFLTQRLSNMRFALALIDHGDDSVDPVEPEVPEVTAISARLTALLAQLSIDPLVTGECGHHHHETSPLVADLNAIHAMNNPEADERLRALTALRDEKIKEDPENNEHVMATYEDYAIRVAALRHEFAPQDADENEQPPVGSPQYRWNEQMNAIHGLNNPDAELRLATMLEQRLEELRVVGSGTKLARSVIATYYARMDALCAELGVEIPTAQDIPPVEPFVMHLLNALTLKGWLHGWENQPTNGEGCIVMKIVDDKADTGASWLCVGYDDIAPTIESFLAGIKVACGVSPYGREEIPQRPVTKEG